MKSRTVYSVGEALRLKLAKKLAEQAGDVFSDGRAYWLMCADQVLGVLPDYSAGPREDEAGAQS